MINKKLFTNADLNGSYQLVHTHNLNNEDVIPSLLDNNGVQYPTSDIFALGDGTGSNDANCVTISFGAPIAGNWKLLLAYETAGSTSTGRRAFELTENNDPSTDFRLIFGKEDTPAANITFANLIAWLLTKLGFLKVTSNLSDLNNASTARSNLGVYSQAQVDTAVATKATLYQSGSGAVIGVSNTAQYRGTGNWHPALLRDVKNIGFSVQLAGEISSDGDIVNTYHQKTSTFSSSRTGNGFYRITHNRGNSSYVVFGSTKGAAETPMYFGRVEPSANYFDVSIANDSSKDDSGFNFIMIAFNTYIS